MVTRSYVCANCDHKFTDENQKLHGRIKRTCPVCKKKKLYQDYGNLYVGDSSPKTLGALADRHRDKAGVYGRQERDHKDEVKLPDHKPWYNPEGRKTLKKVGKMNDQQKKDYILYGKE